MCVFEAVEVPVLVCLRSRCNHVTEVGRRKVRENRAGNCDAKWRGLCVYNPAIRCTRSECFIAVYVAVKYRVIQNDYRGTIVQRQFLTKLGKQPPSDNSNRRWYAQFQERGCVCIPVLKVRIRTAIETITADVRNEIDYCVDVCRVTKGAHIEHL